MTQAYQYPGDGAGPAMQVNAAGSRVATHAGGAADAAAAGCRGRDRTLRGHLPVLHPEQTRRCALCDTLTVTDSGFRSERSL